MASPLLKWGLPILTGTGSLVGWQIYSKQGRGAYAPPFPTNYLTNFNQPNVLAEDFVEAEPASQELVEHQQTDFEQVTTLHPTFDTELEQKKKEEIRAEADKVFEKLNDYTFRIFSPCGSGTGWVLDYQIPKEGHYPTVWYIATNAHVIKPFRFSQNPYEQELHISDRDTRWLWSKWKRSVQFDHMSLWHNSCTATEWYGWYDMSLSHSSNGKELGLDKGMVHSGKIEEPNLFFLATNFLKEDKDLGVDAENYRDFAVLEIKFKDEAFAKEVTRGFADKYKVESTDTINIFADSLETRYDWNQLSTLEDNFYTLGYPTKWRDKWQYFEHNTNFDKESARAGRLSNWYTQKEEDKVRGLIRANQIGSVEWGGKKKTKVGNLVVLDELKDHRPTGGSSGSMYTDKDGNLVGLKSIGGGDYHAFLTPVRSKEIRDGRGKLLSPEYDLILGGKRNQISSYKQQVEKYILKSGKKTWLSSRNWKHKPS